MKNFAKFINKKMSSKEMKNVKGGFYYWSCSGSGAGASFMAVNDAIAFADRTGGTCTKEEVI
ncbi:MAG: natural product precursor [Flammeovirgaceae bacterium]|jgi:natural product precursor